MKQQTLCLLGWCLAMALLAHGRDLDSELLWGTYKPQLIHSITQRNTDTYNPITVSLMYFNPKVLGKFQDLKYQMIDRNSDSQIYNFDYHDTTSFAVHRIIDPDVHLNSTQSFLKLDRSLDHQEWLDVIKNEAPASSSDQFISVIVLVGLEQFNSRSPITKTIMYDTIGQQRRVKIYDKVTQTIEFLTILNTGEQKNTKVGHKAYQSSEDQNWNMSQTIYADLKNSYQNPFFLFSDSGLDRGSIIAFQYIFNLQDKFELQLHYDSLQSQMQPYDYAPVLLDRIQQFQTKFDSAFKKASVSDQQYQCAASSFTNLEGGIQFSYGNILCDNSSLTTCKSNLPLFSHTPARIGFPRPFLWDNGFHKSIECMWDADVCLQELIDWFGTMNEDGWIPREQPRGAELRSYIPWLAENHNEANPPTLIFSLMYLLNLKQEDITEKLAALYPSVVTWYNWWFKTQGVYDKSHQHTYMFKWWGPDESSNLGSGMDDWPRVTTGFHSIYNIDATAWMYLFASKMSQYAQALGKTEDANKFASEAALYKKNTNANMLDTKSKIYYDLLVNDVMSGLGITKFSPHFGYANFFPLFFGMVDPSDAETLKAQAAAMLDASTVWTDYGLASLSKQDPYYGKTSNYWRGPIWINIHYMLLRAIKTYYWGNQDMQNLYTKLRNNIVNTVCGNWERHGYFFEIFNQKYDGQRNGNHPFSKQFNP